MSSGKTEYNVHFNTFARRFRDDLACFITREKHTIPNKKYGMKADL